MPDGLTPVVIQVIPSNAADGALYTVSGPANASGRVSGGQVTLPLIDGEYTLTIQQEGYSNLGQNFTVPDITFIAIQLHAEQDPAGDQVPVDLSRVYQDPALSPGTAVALAGTPLDSPEFIAPLGEDGKYFTSTQARMYVGNLFIDELNYIQFALQDNQIPVFGYASRDFDDLAQGKALVQGQLGINFISEGYLYTMLREFRKNQGSRSNPSTAASEARQNQLNQYSRVAAAPPVDTPEADMSLVYRAIDDLAASEGPVAVAAAGNYVRRQLRQFTENSGYANPAYLNISFDVEIDFDGAGRTITRRLEGVRLTGNEMILNMGPEGSVVIDAYSFIARRLN